MSSLAETAVEIHQWLTRRNIRHVFIGGFAVQCWSEERNTADVDVCIVVPDEDMQETISAILRDFEPRMADADFVLRTRVALVRTRSGVLVDVIFAGLPFEKGLTDRAAQVEVLPGHMVPVCCPDDLVILKAVAGRPRDILDIQAMVGIHGRNLNIRRIRKTLKQFCALLEENDPLLQFDRAWKRYRPKREG